MPEIKIDWNNLSAKEIKDIVESAPLVFTPWFGTSSCKDRFSLDCQEKVALSANYSWSKTNERFVATVSKINKDDLSFPNFTGSDWEELISERFSSMDQAIFWLENYALEKGWKLL